MKRRCRSYWRLVHVRSKPLEHVPDADIHVVRLGEDVRVSLGPAVSVATHNVSASTLRSVSSGRFLHHVDGHASGWPSRVDPEPAPDDAVDAVGGNQQRRLELAAVPRADPHAIRQLAGARHLRPFHHLHAGLPREIQQQGVELDAAHHQGGGLV